MHARALVLCFAAASLGCPGGLENPERFGDGGQVVGDAGGGVVCDLDIENPDGGLFKVSCGGAGCHESPSPSQMLDLVSPGAKARVAAQVSTCRGKPMASFMLEITGDSNVCNKLLMPLGKPRLTEVEKKCLEDWVKSATDGGI